ncbi:RNA polymerase sigma factor [Spongiactinospora sp. 9N601]|uniref:RNA polymerase sigma factor n=1 Tax=Spongiactinospora sp. 9N601 TaxID=3375149 RepID=UPI0037980309
MEERTHDVRPGELLVAAAHGDQEAWDALVSRFGAAMWSTARACGLGAADAEDAVQAAWLRLLESMGGIREPHAVGLWLVTTTRREAIRLAGRRRREHPAPSPAEEPAHAARTAVPDIASAVLDADEAGRLWRAVESMNEPCRSLLRLMATAPDAGTQRLAVRLGMPPGSVGPTRARCLRRLRTIVDTREAAR